LFGDGVGREETQLDAGEVEGFVHGGVEFVDGGVDLILDGDEFAEDLEGVGDEAEVGDGNDAPFE